MLLALLRRETPATLRELQAETGRPIIPFVTLFRSMLRFEKIHLVRRTLGLDSTTRWSINQGGPQHFHVTCRRTRAVAELDSETAAAIRRVLDNTARQLRDRGYADVQLNVAFHGVKRRVDLALLEDRSDRQVG